MKVKIYRQIYPQAGFIREKSLDIDSTKLYKGLNSVRFKSLIVCELERDTSNWRLSFACDVVFKQYRIANNVYQPTSVLLRCFTETKSTVRCLGALIIWRFQHCHRHCNYEHVHCSKVLEAEDMDAKYFKVIAQLKSLPLLKGHERCFESNEYRKHWRDKKLAILF